MHSGLTRLLTLARVSNLPTVWSNCLAAWFISGAQPSWLLLPLLAGASLLYAGGCTLNDAFDAKWDARHRPERLIPSGQLPARYVWLIGSYEMLAGVLLILFCHPSSIWPVTALAVAIVIYDAWHKQSPLSVVTMGACRWLLYVTAASVTGEPLRGAMICGAVLWLYIIVLSLVARGEARRNAGASGRSRWLLLLVPAALAAVGMTGLLGNDPDSRGRVFGYAFPVWLESVVLFTAGLAVMLPWRSGHVGTWVNRLLAAIPILDLALVAAALPAGFVSRESLAVILSMTLFSLWFQRWFKAT